MQAALDGAREIGFTVISLTLSLIAVFIPLLFMTGLVGRMFREFALTLTIAVVVSAIVSLTLTPMMCATLLRHQPRGRAATGCSRGFNRLDRRASSRAIAAASSGCCATSARRCWSPLADAGHHHLALRRRAQGLPAARRTPASSPPCWRPSREVSFAEMSGCRTQVADAVPQGSRRRGRRLGRRRQPAQPDAQRRAPQDHAEAARRARGARRRHHRPAAAQRSAAIPGITVYFQPVQDMQIAHAHQPRAVPVHAGRHRAAEVADVVDQARRRAARRRRACARSPPRRRTAACARCVEVDRETAGRLGVSMQAVNDALNDAFGQRQISTIYAQANQYRVVLEAHAAVPERSRRARRGSTSLRPTARRCR